MNFEYKPKSIEQLRQTYNRRVRQVVNGFDSFIDFHDWYQHQKLVCHYCGLTEVESQKIAMIGILTSKRFPQNGVVGQGTNRGVWLEVDRQTPNESYSRDNCVLCCYFCNNDKSDVFSGNEYMNFYQNRVEYLRRLLNESLENKLD